MASTFLNISTDTTLGGNSTSDSIVSSQKAVKTYVDSHSGGSYTAGDGIVIDNNEISVDGLSTNEIDTVTTTEIDTVTTTEIDTVTTGEVTLAAVATSGSYSDLSNKPMVDQVYNAASTNAQSGVAIAGVLGDIETLLAAI